MTPLCPIPPPQPVKFRQHFSQIFCMFPPQISLLHLSPPTPNPSLRPLSIHSSKIGEHFVLHRDKETTSTNHTVRRQKYGMVYARPRGDGVAGTYRRRFDTSKREIQH